MADTAHIDVATMLDDAQSESAAAVGRPGDWLSGVQRVAAWAEARAAATDPLDAARRAALSPASVDGSHAATDVLPAAAVEIVHRLASDPGRLSRSWADEQVAALGEETYTELVGVTAIAAVIDRFDAALGRPPRPLPRAEPGDPARRRPDDVGDVGAWVSQSTDKVMANVSRTLSLVPATNAAWRPLVTSHYSRGADFVQLVWDRALSRPQVELVAARTTALNECFY